MPHYQKPDWFTRNIFNRLVAGAAKVGISVAGSRELAVRGRKSGEWRTTPVNPMTIAGARYLVAPRGETQWVRNLRAAGSGELRKSGKAEPFVAEEVADADKPPLLREYLKFWKWEAGQFFQNRTAQSTDAELLEIAPLHPIFRITPGDGTSAATSH
ncbi:MAG TPA: nitroreductase/quinone reductase family protein [Dehalococcoidia bacterium]|jgi:deazaflavin-dependent oxidoreductase (nitroreductase family)